MGLEWNRDSQKINCSILYSPQALVIDDLVIVFLTSSSLLSAYQFPRFFFVLWRNTLFSSKLDFDTYKQTKKHVIEFLIYSLTLFQFMAFCNLIIFKLSPTKEQAQNR